VNDSFLSRLLSWLEGHRGFFRLSNDPDHDCLDSDLQIGPHRQAFGELGLLCTILERHPGIRASEEFNVIVDHLEQEADNAEYVSNIVKMPYFFPAYLMEFVALNTCGKALPSRRRALQRILDMGFVGGVERTAWKQIDLLYFLERGGFRHPLPGWDLLYRTSSICRLPPIPHLRLIDIYALTHIVFFSADFGRQDIRPMLQDEYENLCGVVTLLLGSQVHAKDWDLVAELLICCICLRHYPQPLFDLAGRALAQAQLPAGDIPARYYDPLSPLALSPETAAEYHFWQNYHPTLVSLACAVLTELYFKNGAMPHHDCRLPRGCEQTA
jgi:hypothetical protein